MKLYKDILEGGMIPKGYGVSWRCYQSCKVRCYPIPINLIIRLSKHIYYAIMYGLFKSKWERELLIAYFNGMKDKRTK